MKKLFFKLSVLFFPVIIVIVFTNYYIDPANIFSGDKYVEKIASALSKGNNVDNISNYNERRFQKYFLELQPIKFPDIIVMGSSRIMEISSNIYPNKKLFNIGVSHANINDLIALTGLIDELKIKPKEIIINVDPFLICKGEKGVDEWMDLKEYHQKFLLKNYKNIKSSEIEKSENQFKKFYQLISFEYFQNSIEFLYKGNSKTVQNIGNKIPLKYGRFSDGSIAYSESYKNPDTIIVANIAKGESKINVPNMDSTKLSYFNGLIDYFMTNNISLNLIMLPFHPNYYNQVNSNQNNIFTEYEAFFKKFAEKKNIKIIGSFSAQKEGLTQKDFYDTYHCSGNAIKTIFENYKYK